MNMTMTRFTLFWIVGKDPDDTNKTVCLLSLAPDFIGLSAELILLRLNFR